MKPLLLDTNAFIWLTFQPSKARKNIASEIADRLTYVSHVCAIEIMIKYSLGKLELPLPLRTAFAYEFSLLVEDLNAELLPLKLHHIGILGTLPQHHRDPFDRLLIAQAISEDFGLLSSDGAFAAYEGLDFIRI